MTDLEHQVAASIRERVERDVPDTLNLWPRMLASRATSGAGVRHRPARSRVVSLLPLTVLLATLLVLPPVRTLAQTLLVRIGVLQVTHSLTGAQRAIADPHTRLLGFETSLLSVEEAQQQLGDRVFVPADPNLGYLLQSRNVYNDAQGLRVKSGYVRGAGAASQYLDLEQFASSATPREPFAISTATVTEIEVRGQAGLWITDAPIGLWVEQGQFVGTATYHGLLWAEAGRTFWLFSDSIGQADLLEVAESLQP